VSEARRRALFADLVFNDEGQVAEVVLVGAIPHYAVPDGDFLRHVDAEQVDRQVVRVLQKRFSEMSDAVADSAVQLLGHEGLFTRASIKHAIEHMDQLLEPGAVDLDDFRTALWMSKFRVVVDRHGDVIEVELPGLGPEESQ
jgi:hypothetical protein